MTEVGDLPPGSGAEIASTSKRRWVENAAVALSCLMLFCGSFFLYTRYNDSSVFYHPDEPTKVGQIVLGKRNFQHPQLMLEATELALKWFSNKPTHREIILTGRRVSAAFAALVVITLALTGYRYGGFEGLLLAGISVGLCPSLLLNAHYMKEDTALLLGIALTLFAALIYCTVTSRKSRIVALLFLGVAAAVASSGKYVGITALAAVLILAVLTPPWSWEMPLRWIAILFAFAVTAALINYRVLEDWTGFSNGLSREVAHGVSGHGGLTMNRPNLFFTKGLVRETMPHALLLAAVFLISLATCWRRTRPWDLFLSLFAISFALVISDGVIPEYRYNLPIVVMLYLMAALAVIRLSWHLPLPWRRAAVIMALAILVPLQLQRCLNYLDQFADDSRVRLHSFVVNNVPTGSVILADRYTALQFEDDPRISGKLDERSITVETSNWVADLGELQSFRLLGVDYVAVSEKAYGRFFQPEIRPAPGDSRYQARRRFYEELFAKQELIWSSTPNPPTYSFVNPALRLYRLRD